MNHHIKVDAIGLGCAAVSGLLQKTNLNPEHIDEIIWGNVGMFEYSLQIKCTSCHHTSTKYC